MIKVSVYAAIGLILTVLESSLLYSLPIEFFKPDLGIPFIVYTSFFLGPQEGLVTAVFVGILQELLSAAPAGAMVFTKVSIFLLCIFMKKKIYIDSRYTFAFGCSGAVLVESSLFLALSFLTKGEANDFGNIVFYSIPNAIFTGFVSLFIFSLIGFVNIRYLDRQ